MRSAKVERIFCIIPRTGYNARVFESCQDAARRISVGGNRMKSKMITAPFALLALLIVSGCGPLSPPALQGDVTSPAQSGLSSGVLVPGPTKTVTLATPITTSERLVTATPTSESLPELVEEDCMGACHFPEPGESFAVGAIPQPADHKGRATCLECHKTLAKPALPKTHEGRMDPACALCHLPPDTLPK